MLFMMIPKGFFPVQDTGVILGVSEAPQTISFPAMSERQQDLAKVILQDPAVESLSSFIGIDGTNTTLNSGRIQINLKPLEERKLSATDDHPPAAAASWPRLKASRCYMQPVQDLTVEDRVSRTQFPVHAWRIRTRRNWPTWAAAIGGQTADAFRSLRDVASDQQNGGLQAALVIDRDTASRFGITPQAIDNTLYDAFGQRQISIMFTQLNQYHVVLEVEAGVSAEPGSA